MVGRERAERQVYQPAEDSRLLAETAAEALADLPQDARVVDVGTGSGYVAARVAEATGTDVLGTDISPLAVREARDHGVAVVRSDMLDALTGPFDAVTFNPPYLPTDPDAEWDDWMEYALSGGPDGRRAVDPFLDDLPRVLAADGRGFLLVSSLTDVDAVARRATANGLATRELADESFPFERLVVLELTHAG
jgi:release factor glutamine methyltransferase